MIRERAKYVIDFRTIGSSFRYSFSGPRGSFNAPTDPKVKPIAYILGECTNHNIMG